MAKRKTAPQLVTRQQLAKAFTVTPGTITRWERDGMPVAKRPSRGKHSLFDPTAVRNWREAQDQAGGSATFALSASRAKLADKQIERLDLEMALKRGELVHRDQVIRDGQAQVRAWSAKVRAIPRRAVQIGAIQANQVAALEAMCRDILTEISQWKTFAEAQ